MSSNNKGLTPDQVRARFHRQGKTLSQWAAEHGYPRNEVYKVMGGNYRAHYGRAHEIAVKLGLIKELPEDANDEA